MAYLGTPDDDTETALWLLEGDEYISIVPLTWGWLIELSGGGEEPIEPCWLDDPWSKVCCRLPNGLLMGPLTR